MNPIRVLAVLEASTITGPAKNLLQFAELGRDAVQLEIAVFRRPGDPDVLVQAASRAGVAVHAITERRAYDRSVVRQLRSLAQRLRPEIVQTHAVKSHLLGWMAGFGRPLPWIAFHHGYTWQNARVRLINQLDRLSLRHATRVVTVSQPFLKEVVARGVRRENVRVIHNAIDPQWAATARRPETAAALRSQLGISPERKIALIVGRLSLEKDHAAFLRAVAELPDVHALIVGDGPERPVLEELGRSLRIANRVTFTGQTPSAEPYYGVADVAVLSSRTEGSPNALLEAMAAGVPAVATKVGGVPEIATDRESALLISPGDVGQLRDAVAETLKDAALRDRLTRQAREAVLLRHSPHSRVRRLCEEYGSVLGRRPSQGFEPQSEPERPSEHGQGSAGPRPR